MEPALRLLHTLKDYKISYIHRDVGTREELISI